MVKRKFTEGEVMIRKRLLYIGLAAFFIVCFIGNIENNSFADSQKNTTDMTNREETIAQISEEVILSIRSALDLAGEQFRQVDYSYEWFKERIVQVVPEEIAVQFPESGSCKWNSAWYEGEGWRAIASVRDAPYSKNPDYPYGSKIFFALSFEEDKLEQYEAKYFEIWDSASADDYITEEQGKELVQKFAGVFLGESFALSEITVCEAMSGYEGDNFRTYEDSKGNKYLVQLNLNKMVLRFYAE